MLVEKAIVKKKGTKKVFTFTDEMIEELKKIGDTIRTNKGLAEFYGVCEDTIERAFKRQEQAKRVWLQARRKNIEFVKSNMFVILSDPSHPAFPRMSMWYLEHIGGFKAGFSELINSDESLKSITITYETPEKETEK